MTLGEIIKEYRSSHDMSMDEFSKKSGISKSYISLLEKNQHPQTGKPISPSINSIMRAAKCMDMDFKDLLDQIQNDTNSSPSPYSYENGDRIFPTVSEEQNNYCSNKCSSRNSELTELPQIKEMISNENYELISQKEIDTLTLEIDKSLDEYCHSITGTGAFSRMIDCEKEITHELFDDIIAPYVEQPIFDIVKVLTFYLTLNYDGKKLVLDFLKCCCNNQKLKQKNYNPISKRPMDCKRNKITENQYFNSLNNDAQTNHDITDGND